MSYENQPRSASRAAEFPAPGRRDRPNRTFGKPVVERDDQTVRTPRGRPYTTTYDWRRVALLGAVLAAGALIGAGAALLTAPASGARTRRRLSRGVARARLRAAEGWDAIGDRVDGRPERHTRAGR